MLFKDFIQINPKVDLKKGETYPYVGMADVNPSRGYVTNSETREYKNSRSKFREGDTLFARITPCLENGKITRFKSDGIKKGFGSTEFIVFRAKEGVSDPNFVYYLSRSQLIRKTAEKSMAGASGRQRADITAVEEVEIDPPDLPTQQKVASILSAFDDLIENNSRRIEILEEVARRIYREWFVHFRYPGHEEDELVDSGTELGEVPEGWEVNKLLDVCNLQTGKALRSKQFNEDGNGVKAVRIRNVRTNSSETYTDEEFDDKYLVENGDILVGMDGDFHICRWADGQSVLVQRVARFRPKKEVGLSKYFFYWAIKKPIDYFNRTITGTTVAHLGKKHIKTIEILLPPENLREHINEILDPMYEQDLALRKQNKKLKETRDLLLTKLISGEIDVKEVKI